MFYSRFVSTNVELGSCKINRGTIKICVREFKKKNVDLDLLKKPRREDDAIIFVAKDGSISLCVKIFPDVWIASAEHLRKPNFFKSLSTSNYLPTVHFSYLDKKNHSILYVYDYLDGVTLSSIINDLSSKEKKFVLGTLVKCLEELVTKYRLDVNFDNLDDFIINNDDLSQIALVDFNSFFQASELISTKDLLRIVKSRALKKLPLDGLERGDVYQALYSSTNSTSG